MEIDDAVVATAGWLLFQFSTRSPKKVEHLKALAQYTYQAIEPLLPQDEKKFEALLEGFRQRIEREANERAGATPRPTET